MFCSECGTLLVPKKTSYGNWMSCPRGHSQSAMVEKGYDSKESNRNVGKRLEVADDVNHLAVYDYPCKKCGHGKAEMLHVGTFYSDEDDVVNMKCGKCGFVERLEGKTS